MGGVWGWNGVGVWERGGGLIWRVTQLRLQPVNGGLFFPLAAAIAQVVAELQAIPLEQAAGQTEFERAFNPVR